MSSEVTVRVIESFQITTRVKTLRCMQSIQVQTNYSVPWTALGEFDQAGECFSSLKVLGRCHLGRDVALKRQARSVHCREPSP